MTLTCPNCGNFDRSLIQDNGLPEGDVLFTLLCVAPVALKDSTASQEYWAERPGEQPLCLQQWEPNNPQ